MDTVKNGMVSRERIEYFDYLRVFAALAVIILHVATAHIRDTAITGSAWIVMNLYNSLVRWGVPVFVMISGALFLSRELSMKKVFTKNIARLAVAYVVWSAFYAVVIPLGKHLLTPDYEISVGSILKNVITGADHMWFIPMLIGLYLCLPIFCQIVLSEKATKYFLILAFVFAFLIPQIVNLSVDFTSGPIAEGAEALNTLVSKMKLQMVTGYSGYFIAGYVLSRKELNRKLRRWIYAIGIVGFVLTAGLSLLASLKAGTFVDHYYGNFNCGVVLEAVAVFTWCKYNLSGSPRWVLRFSKDSFGIYLVHVFALELILTVGLDTLSFSPIISIPVISLIVALVSWGISYLLHKIPVLNRWIV